MISLGVKYRPQTLDEVIGQDAIVKVLKRQIETNNIKLAYMFSGASGVGKTTIARCFAKTINNSIGEPIEIDAASNNGVENIRNIVKEASERSIEGKYKVIILDEVHNLSSTAFQPLLKCFEEPLEYTIFILCTTDPQKVPETILNRAQRFNFNRISTELIRERLEHVCKNENFTNYEDSIDYISKIANGCMREALTLLGKVADYDTNFSIENTLSFLGVHNYSTHFNLINSMLDGNMGKVLEIIDNIYDKGGDLKIFVDQLLNFVIDIAKYILFNNIEVTNIPKHLENEIKNIINFDSPLNYYNYLMDKLLNLKNMLKVDTNIKATVEVVCIQITRMH